MEKLREELSLMKKRYSDLENFMRQSGFVSRQSLAEFPDWDEFEFCTKKKGANGPSKNECLEYYSEK